MFPFIPKIQLRIIIYASSFLVLLLVSIWIFSRVQTPPFFNFRASREAISKAKKVHADVYAKKDFQKAEDCYHMAMKLWRQQNKKNILNRDYSQVTKNVIQSKIYADRAYSSAIVDKEELKEKLNNQIKDLKEQIKKLQPLFNKLPIPSDISKKNSHAQLLLFEVERTFNRGRYNDIATKLDKADKDIRNSYNFATQMLNDYFTLYPRWIRQADQARTMSKNNGSYSILVDKFSRECFVYFNGTLKNKFEVELGKNWIGEKLYSGDQATPEGLYYIVKKKDSRKTKYYKALLLDYPNDEDRARFKNGKDNGTLEMSSKIGNLIEIHGEGGKGIDWTNGCISLENRDMDKLYQLVGENTPVTIVGSLKPLSEILNDLELR